MNFILSIPLEVRLAAVFLLGICIGSAANWAIYALAWFPRPISPWSRPDPSVKPRKLWDRLPIVGWFGLRREAPLHGAGFWVRPMLLELLTGCGLAWLYWWETETCRLVLPIDVGANAFPPEILWIFHLEFASHCILIALMLAASMIDVDEKTIPDEITIPGTLVGLLLAAAWPQSLLPDLAPSMRLEILHLTAPNDWPAMLNGFPQRGSLAIGLACWWLWCFALLPRTWYGRHGVGRALGLSWARITRHPVTYRILRMAIVGSLVIGLVWYRDVPGWKGLLTALVGVVGSGGLVWLVRIIGAAALKREAMGFGDVTLMAMIGAYLGWQPCLVIFFLAPFAGLVIGLLRLVLFRDKEIPYGPFLCLATLFVIVRWYDVWDYVVGFFQMGGLVPIVVFGCLLLMLPMLGAWRLILNLFSKP
jgi:prepilin signal peptidase PulO-like enzyme (type II secretory pathway)